MTDALADRLELAALAETCNQCSTGGSFHTTRCLARRATISALAEALRESEERVAKGVLARIEEVGGLIEERDAARCEVERLRAVAKPALKILQSWQTDWEALANDPNYRAEFSPETRALESALRGEKE